MKLSFEHCYVLNSANLSVRKTESYSQLQFHEKLPEPHPRSFQIADDLPHQKCVVVFKNI